MCGNTSEVRVQTLAEHWRTTLRDLNGYGILMIVLTMRLPLLAAESKMSAMARKLCKILGIAVAVALTFVPRWLEAQDIAITQDAEGYVYVEFETALWFSYELQSSPDLTTWSPTEINNVLGWGQTVKAFVYDSAAATPADATAPSEPPAGEFFFLRPFHDGTTLISWNGEDGAAYQVLDPTDMTDGMGQSFNLEITDDLQPPSVLYTVRVSIAPAMPAPQDYSTATAASLPATENATWSLFAGARAEILAAIAEPPIGTTIENAGNAAAGTGALMYFRVVMTVSDSDGDGLSNELEALMGTNPYNPDTDFDGFGDAYEVSATGGDPLNSGIAPPPLSLRIVSIDRYLSYAYDDYEYEEDEEPDFLTRRLETRALWTSPSFLTQDELSAPISLPLLNKRISSGHAFPARPPWGSTIGVRHGYTSSQATSQSSNNVSSAGINAQRVWLAQQPSISKNITRAYIKLLTEISISAPRQLHSAEVVELRIPAGGNLSNFIDIDPAFRRDVSGAGAYRVEYIDEHLLSIGRAPDVLPVNSDFDEGRIDPATGYAIPDCDDVPGTDPVTGAGNGELRIDTDREHLDGLYANDERVTDDMHKGWFGVTPGKFFDEVWAGATVTIRKLPRIDAETGRAESGQIRFYAKWGNTYYGITPYDLETLAPNNLVTSGVNKRPGEGVYGATSTIPDNADFYMEGVRPGKITLEWRMQKDGVDARYEQTFLVETRKSPADWKKDLAYKIRLDTANDPSGEIDVSVDPKSVVENYWPMMERLSEYYDYYQENFLVDNDFQWCGLARLAGSQVVGGVSDAMYGTHQASPILTQISVEIMESMRDGGYDIFSSLAWQFHAYRSSGIGALEWTNDNSGDQDLGELFEDWRDLDDGKISSNSGLVARAANGMTDYEQNTIIIPTWVKLSSIGQPNMITDIMTLLAKNVMTPSGDSFLTAVPGGNLANAADRWKWIDDGPAGSANGVIGAWRSAGTATQLNLVSKTLRDDANRFDLTPPPLPVQVRDHLDTP